MSIILLGQLTSITAIELEGIRHIAETLTRDGHSGFALEARLTEYEPFSWTMQIQYPLDLDELRRRDARTSLRAILAICREIGPGTYYARGYSETRPSTFWATDFGICVRDYLFHSIPLVIEVSHDQPPVIDLPIWWISKYLADKFSGLISPDRNVYILETAPKDVLYYASSMLCQEGPWLFRLRCDDQGELRFDHDRHERMRSWN